MEGALEVRISDEEVLSNEEMLIERYNDQWALIENKKIQYQLFKGALDEKEIHLAELVETKINEIHEKQTDLMMAKLQDEFDLRELSNRIVTERINDALMNVVKDEYNKKIKIICNESNQNQIKAAKKIHLEHENTMEEFKLKIKSLERALDEAKSLVKNRVKETEQAWTQRYQKLNEEKNDEIKKHLKKSIDLIDENELLENQLEKLYLLIEEKNLQINYLEEREFEYQNELKRLHFDLNSGDVIGYQKKILNSKEMGVLCDIIQNNTVNRTAKETQEIGVLCDIIVQVDNQGTKNLDASEEEADENENDNNITVFNVQNAFTVCENKNEIENDDINNISIDGNEVNEILKNNLNEPTKVDKAVEVSNSKNKPEDSNLDKNSTSSNSHFTGSEAKPLALTQTHNPAKNVHQILESDLDYLSKRLLESKKILKYLPNKQNTQTKHDINSKNKLIHSIVELLDEKLKRPKTQQNQQRLLPHLSENYLDSLNNLIMIFLTNNSSFDLSRIDTDNLRYQSMTDDDTIEINETQMLNEEIFDRIQINASDIRNQDLNLNNANQGLLAALTKSLTINSSIEEHINQRISGIIHSSQISSHTCSENSNSSSPRNSLSERSGKKTSSTTVSNSSASQSPIQGRTNSHSDGSSRGTSPASLKFNSPRSTEDSSENFSENTINNNCSDEILKVANLERSPEIIIESNLKIQTTIEKLLNMFEDTSKQLVESHFLQSQLSKKLEESQKSYVELKLKYESVAGDTEVAHTELLNKINNLEGLANAYELDLQAKNQAYMQLEQILQTAKEELADAKSSSENDKFELENLNKIKLDLEAQRDLFTQVLDNDDVKGLIEKNAILLDEKHQLEYKLTKETEMSRIQIKDLEQTVEQFNSNEKFVKDTYEDQIYELKKQIEAMDVQINREKEFIDSQMAEREQERDEYESKIKQLNEIIDRKSTKAVESETDAQLKIYLEELEIKVKELEILLQERTDRLNKLSIVNEELERTKSDVELVEQYKQEIDTMLVANKKQNESLDYLKEKLNVKEGLCVELTVKVDSMSSQIEQNTEEKENLQSQLYEYMSRFSELQLHNESLQEERRVAVEKWEEKIRSLSFAVEEKTQQCDDLKRKINELNEDFEGRLEAEVNQSKLEYEQNAFENVKLKEQTTGLREKLQKVEEELEFLSKSRLSEDLIASKNEEIEEAKAKLAENERIILSQNDEIEEIKAKLADKEDEIKELKDIIDGNEWNKDVSEAVVSGLEMRNADLMNEINQLKDIEAHVDATVGELKSRVAESAEEIKILQRENETLKCKCEKEKDKTYQEEITKLTDKNIELSTKVNGMDSNSEDNSSPDTSLSNELGQKLKEQVNLTAELDSELNRHFTKQLKKPVESSKLETPENIKRITEMIQAGEVNFLNLAELLEYRAFLFGCKDQDENCGLVKLKIQAVENEKNKLSEEIYALKKLLANVSCDVVKSLEGESALEWRKTILNGIAETFQKENELQVAELRRFVVNGSSESALDDIKKITFLESKINGQTGLHEKALKALEKSLNEEAENKLKSKFESEIARLLNVEKQLKKEIKLLEYNKDAEDMKTNDLRQSLNNEKSKCIEIMDTLNQEKKRTNELQERVVDLGEELERTKEVLNTENEHLQAENRSLQNRVNSLRDAELESVKIKEVVKQERSKNEKLQSLLNEMQNKENRRNKMTTKGNPQNNLEHLRQNLEHLAFKIRHVLESQSITKQQQIHTLTHCVNDVIQELATMSDASNGTYNLYPFVEKITSANANMYETNNEVINLIEKKWIDQNRDLLNTIHTLNNERYDQENTIQRLADEVRHYKTKRAELSEHDKEKFKKLYLKYLRAESFRKSLVYQKRFLIIMLSGYEETEREILATLKFESNLCSHSSHSSSHSSSNNESPIYSPNMSPSNNQKNRSSYGYRNNNNNNNNHTTNNSQIATRGPRDVHMKNGTSIYSSRFRVFRAKSRFRTAVISVIAISRIKFLVKKHSGILGKVENHYRR